MLKNFVKKIVPESVKCATRRMLGVDRPLLVDANSAYSYPSSWMKSHRFYGQYGEDAKLKNLFSGKKDGYFVEVGAMEGIRFSNTYLFERMGWKGICIEPHPDYFSLLQHNRPGSILIRAAAGGTDKDAVDFYTNYRGSMSTLDKSLEGFFRAHYGSFFGGFKTIQVPQVTLNSVFEKHHVPISIDLLSLDTEGTEEDVFGGFDVKKYMPRVIIAEISIKREPVERIMKELGYVECCTNPSNAIFCRNEEDAEVVRNTCVVGEQVTIPHPLDEHHEQN
ncbi:MAG: FkbM family methyltransferase [Candidatus Paceibacterota bacterium]|jgi:FkbM family methyltransferase